MRQRFGRSLSLPKLVSHESAGGVPLHNVRMRFERYVPTSHLITDALSQPEHEGDRLRSDPDPLKALVDSKLGELQGTHVLVADGRRTLAACERQRVHANGHLPRRKAATVKKVCRGEALLLVFPCPRAEILGLLVASTVERERRRTKG